MYKKTVSSKQIKAFRQRYTHTHNPYNTKYQVVSMDKEQGMIEVRNQSGVIEVSVNKETLDRVTTDMYIVINPTERTTSRMHFSI